MYYCFLKEDLDGLTKDPLTIQKEYAQQLGALCVGSLEQQAIFDDSGLPVDVANKKVLLRCTYDNLIAGLHLLVKHGAKPMETEDDIERIEDWHKLGLTSRQLWEVEVSELLVAPSELLDNGDKIFIKSKCKGFSAVISTARITQRDPEIRTFLETQSRKYGHRMVLSKYLPIKTDSFGTRESRHVILDNQVSSSSRLLHSVKHTVPKSHKTKAQDVVLQIEELGIFPSNYILDMGEFIDNEGNSYLDIVEINPLSSSMCFVNNSIFDVAVPEIRESQKLLQMGYEYCYDAIYHPHRYSKERTSNRSYVFTSDERYYFL